MIASEKRFHLSDVKLFDVFVILFFFVALSGSSNDSYLYVTMGLCLVLLGWLCYKAHFILRFDDSRVLCVLFFLAFITISGYPVGGAFFTAKKVGAAIIEFTPILVFNYYKKEENRESRKFVLAGLLLAVIYYMISAYYTYTNLEVSARRMANHTGDYGELSIGGGYSLAYAVSLLGVYLTDCIKNKRIQGKIPVLGSIGIIIMATLVIYETLSTITLLAYVLGVIITLCIPSVDPYSKDINNVGKPLVMMVLLTVLVFAFSNYIGQLLIKFAEGNTTTMGERLRDLGGMLSNSSDGEYSVNRMSIPLTALKTFLKNPLIGISYVHGNGFFKASLFGAGNHCEWADALCNYGLIGGIPFLYVYYASIRNVYKMHTGRVGLGLAITLFVMGFFNPFRCIQSNTILMLLIPLMCMQQSRTPEEIA